MEPLTWMFKVDNFKKHFWYLLYTGIGFLVAGIIFALISLLFTETLDFISATVVKLINLLLLIIPGLCLTGYFWSLTESIIDREDDITANNIYNGKFRIINKIKLPEFKFTKFVWRGFASVVATILLYLPCILILGYLAADISNVVEFWKWNSSQAYTFYIILIVMCSLFIPGLLWNYARRDSILAVWDLPKAIYIMGNYTGKYLLNTFLFFVLSFINSFLIKSFSVFVGLNFTKTAAENGVSMILVSGSDIIIPLILTICFSYIISIYWLFVNAYLLGTIAPPNEY